MKIKAKDVPIPKIPQIKIIREDFQPIYALFGFGVINHKTKYIIIQIVFNLIIFVLGVLIGYTI